MDDDQPQNKLRPSQMEVDQLYGDLSPSKMDEATQAEFHFYLQKNWKKKAVVSTKAYLLLKKKRQSLLREAKKLAKMMAKMKRQLDIFDETSSDEEAKDDANDNT